MNNSAVASLVWCGVSGQVGFLGQGRLREEAAGLGLQWWASEVEELRGAQESDPSLRIFVSYSYSTQCMGHNKRLPTYICCFNTQRGRDLLLFGTGGLPFSMTALRCWELDAGERVARGPVTQALTTT